MDFNKAISKNLYGNKVILSISDEETEYFFYPKKFSIQGMDEYTAYQLGMQKKVNAESLKTLQEITAKYPGVPPEELQKHLSAEDMIMLANTMSVDSSKLEDLYRLYFRFGIGLNNLNDKIEEKEGLTEKSINKVLDNASLSVEIYDEINKFNNFFSQPPSETK
jgi:hypothetical protein